MNIWDEIAKLPRSSQLALAGNVLRSHRPTIKELAYHTGVGPDSARQWMNINKRRYPKRKQALSAITRDPGL